jgi:uncharacterized membrane protein
MTERKRIYGKIFLWVSMASALLVLTEIIMQSFGKSICFSEGCRVTAQSARFGDFSILLSGLLLFSLLAILSLVSRYDHGPVERLIRFILIVALAGEGFFMGYLAFRIHTLCIFCVIVCGLLMTLSILRLWAGEKEVIAGFAALLAVFSLQYLILPAGVTLNLPVNDRLILFYSKDCKQCEMVIKEIEEKKIAVTLLPANEVSGFLRNMGIEHVPTLLVNDPYHKVFLTGRDAIRRYLLTRLKEGNPPAGEAMLTPDIDEQSGLLNPPNGLASDEGMCKQGENCK